jgi:monofunctional biosynthetic peptidoglycan transglycosylase
MGMFWTWVQNRDSTTNWRIRNSWRSLKEISPHLRKAVLAGEDQRFLSHHGFDFTEMNEAIKDMALRKGFRGASTITMQVARTVFLWPERTWLRKGAEAYYTLVIEIFWTKERILEIYLNTVDWGEGLMGVEAASREYFHTPCLHLSPSQAAALAAILPSPHRWSPTKPNSRVLERKRRILKDIKKMPLV